MPDVTFPHCDSRILHAPGECRYCDAQPTWQRDRVLGGVAFTGHTVGEKTCINKWEITYVPRLPCPADEARGDAHRRWPGNRAEPIEVGDVHTFDDGVRRVCVATGQRSALRIESDGELVFDVKTDGSIEFGPDVTALMAAAAFWEAVRKLALC